MSSKSVTREIVLDLISFNIGLLLGGKGGLKL